DSVANAALLKMFQAYDLVRGSMTTSQQSTVDHWLAGIGNALISGQNAALASGSIEAVNNHHSWQLLEVGTIGTVLNNSAFIHYVTDQSGFLSQIGNNLKSFAGEPAYLGVDYDQRHAYHYVAYNLQALGQLAELVDRIGHLPGNPYGINYNPFTVQVNGASIQNTLDALLPYESGQKTSTTEFQGSKDPNDAARLANGSLSSTYHPSDGLPALAAADYFGHSVTDPLMNNQTYNLAQLTDSIMKASGQTPSSTTLPTAQFLQNTIESPYDGTSTGTSGGVSGASKPVTVKVGTSGGTHSYDGSAGNDTYEFYLHTGQTTISHFGGNDVLAIESKIYSSASAALSHVQYAGGNATLALDSGSSITLTGIADHGLTAGEFHIFS
ncbi:MAG: alginate lyase family protein, partial [Pseudomonadota bacterium]|nr:alginate lyase family protein [Pseudomonadota bacterium]